MAAGSLTTAQEFTEHVVPELLRRWDRHCFCRNEHFLKLISFNFQDYGIAPTSLTDTELVVSSVISRRFEPLTDWIDIQGEKSRIYRCPQCSVQFNSRHEQYSINMNRVTTRPTTPLPMANVGAYIVGFHFFGKYAADLDRILDFKLAESIEAFVGHISTERISQ